MIDMTNTVARNGLVFFPEFCDVVLRKFREDNEKEFAEVMFKVGDVPSNDILTKLRSSDAVWNRSSTRAVQSKEIQDSSEVPHKNRVPVHYEKFTCVCS